MSRAELEALFEEITAILESQSSAIEKLDRIEAVMFEPKEVGDESDADPDDDV